MKTLPALFLLLLISCTHMNEIKEQKAAWIEKDIKEVSVHPVFSHFKVKEKSGKNGTEIITYADGSPVLSDARCQGLGGCMGVDNGWCEHNFTTRNNKIVQYEQYGPCPYNSQLFPTEDSNK